MFCIPSRSFSYWRDAREPVIKCVLCQRAHVCIVVAEPLLWYQVVLLVTLRPRSRALVESRSGERGGNDVGSRVRSEVPPPFLRVARSSRAKRPGEVAAAPESRMIILSSFKIVPIRKLLLLLQVLQLLILIWVHYLFSGQ